MSKTPTESESLLSADFIRRLEHLDVVSRKMLRGRLPGERRSKKRGQSVEFFDYRSYVVGDDLRFVDWNLYARLDRLFLRLFMEEEDLLVSIALDVTASMNTGDPNKLLYAKRVAATLGYIGLVKCNRVNVYAFSDVIEDRICHLRGRQPIPPLLEFLDQRWPPSGRSGNLAEVCRQISMLQRQPGVIILISDFLDKGEISDALRYLFDPNHDVYAMQLLSPQELDPAAAGVLGDLRLTDIEDADVAEVSVSDALLTRYKTNLQAYCRHVRQHCMRRDIAYMAGDTSVPFETLVLHYLREKGLLRSV